VRRARHGASASADSRFRSRHRRRRDGRGNRFKRVADELFAFYERGGPHLEVDVRERQLPGMREWEESQRATVAAFVREALVDDRPDARTVQLLSAFFDLPTFKALRTRGVSRSRAADAAARAAVCLFDERRSP
jgi:hypothetical protein